MGRGFLLWWLSESLLSPVFLVWGLGAPSGGLGIQEAWQGFWGASCQRSPTLCLAGPTTPFGKRVLSLLLLGSYLMGESGPFSVRLDFPTCPAI